MRLSSLVAAAALLSASLAVHADTVQAFSFQGTLTDGYMADGSILIDTTSGQFQISNFSFTNGTTTYSFNAPYYQYSDGFDDTLVQFGSSEADLFFLLPTDSIVGYAGGPVCSDAMPCPDGYASGAYLFDENGNYIGSYDLASGSLTATPEPSSFLLLGTGLFGALGVVRKRFV